MELKHYQLGALRATKYNKKVMVKSCRQMGKTTLIFYRVRDIIKEALSNNTDRSIVIVGMKSQIMKDIADGILNALQDINCIGEIYYTYRNDRMISMETEHAAKIKIHLVHPSRVFNYVFQNCLGIEFTDFIFDECAFYTTKEQRDMLDILSEVKRIYRNQPNFLLVSTSTPGSDFEYLFRHSNEFVKILWNWWDNPDRNKGWLDNVRKTFSAEDFEREWLNL